MKRAQWLYVGIAVIFMLAASFLGAYLPPQPAGGLNVISIYLFLMGALFMGMAAGYTAGFKAGIKKQAE